jgi:uncharacterized protein (UPF0303 family)
MRGVSTHLAYTLRYDGRGDACSMDPEYSLTLRNDLKLIAQQESVLQFAHFNAEMAWSLGSLLRSRLTERGASGSIEIDLAGHVLFACATPGATPGQADWIRRKRNVVRRFHRSSYAIGRQLELEEQTLESRHALTLTDYAVHGGGFPLVLRDSGCVGAIVLSGLPQREDQSLVVATIAMH